MCLAVVMRLRRNLFVKTPIASKMETFTRNPKFVPLKACETPDDLVVPHCNHTTKIEPVYDECGCLKAYRCCPSSCPTPVNNCKTGQLNIEMKKITALIWFPAITDHKGKKNNQLHPEKKRVSWNWWNHVYFWSILQKVNWLNGMSLLFKDVSYVS